MLQPHQERVVKERAELDEKIGKLYPFSEGKLFQSLDKAEQDRLTRQYGVMKRYRDILDERIAVFGIAEGEIKP